ncbi:MAG: fasciclin domain-containing protein [Planctomycetota bacterium]
MLSHQIAPRLIAATLILGSLGAQNATEASASRPTADIVDIATKAGSFETLLTAAKAAGLVETLKSDGPFTVFAPSDDAFAKLPDGTIPALLKDKAKLAAILKYHVVAGRVAAADLTGKSWAETVQGQSVRVQTGDEVRVDGAKVVQADIPASNGLIHVIDTVMLPRPDLVDVAVEAGSFGTLVTAVKAAELVEVLKAKGPFTVFAPSDDAFAKLPDGTIPALLKDKAKLKSVLTFHVVPGRVLAEDLPLSDGDVSASPATVQGSKLEVTRTDAGVTVNGARVIKANVLAGNGVIHVIDTVLLPN